RWLTIPEPKREGGSGWPISANSVLRWGGSQVVAKLQGFRVRRLELQSAINRLLRFREFGFHAQGCRQVDPGFGISGCGANCLAEMFFSRGCVATARI